MSTDDRTLIDQCLAGNPDAFGILVARYQDRLFNGIFRLVRHPEDARDVVQDAFLSAYQALATFHGESRFYTWLFRIALNAALTLRRKQKRVPPTSASSVELIDESEANKPDRSIEMADDERMVHEALQRLSAEHRIVLVLKEIDGLSYDEIAETLNVPIGTVRSRLSRARLELREVLLQMEKKTKR